jgi:hypothetical protein
MRSRVLGAVVLALGMVICASAQGPSYDEMVGKVRGGDTSIDFKALRMAFTGTQQFVSGTDAKLRGKLTEAVKSKKPDEITKTIQEMLKSDFVNMNLHILAARTYTAMGDKKKAEFHTNVYLGLINSVIKVTDGETLDKAYEVISEDEENAILNAFELKRSAAESLEQGGHKYHVITATDGAGASSKIYFNIDKVIKKADTTAAGPK